MLEGAARLYLFAVVNAVVVWARVSLELVARNHPSEELVSSNDRSTVSEVVMVEVHSVMTFGSLQGGGWVEN